MIRVTLNEENVQRAAELMKSCPNIVYRSTIAAINRAITTAKAETAKTVRERYTVKSANVKRAFTVRKASGGSPRAEVIAKGFPLPLASFKYSRRKKGPVRVMVLKKGKMKPIRGLFFNRFPSGYTGPMHRRQKSKYPLASPFGPSVPSMVRNEETLMPAARAAAEMLNKRFLKEINRRLSNK